MGFRFIFFAFILNIGNSSAQRYFFQYSYGQVFQFNKITTSEIPKNESKYFYQSYPVTSSYLALNFGIYLPKGFDLLLSHKCMDYGVAGRFGKGFYSATGGGFNVLDRSRSEWGLLIAKSLIRKKIFSMHCGFGVNYNSRKVTFFPTLGQGYIHDGTDSFWVKVTDDENFNLNSIRAQTSLIFNWKMKRHWDFSLRTDFQFGGKSAMIRQLYIYDPKKMKYFTIYETNYGRYFALALSARYTFCYSFKKPKR